jgi:peptide/nickel transport system substrate-binding protein
VAGIELTVLREANDGYWDNVWLKKPFVASEWLGRPTVDGVLTLAYAADSNSNETFWKNPRFNELLVAARSELDTTKRAAMYAECQQLLHDDGGLINLLFDTYVMAHTKKVSHGPMLSNTDLDGFRISQRWWAV